MTKYKVIKPCFCDCEVQKEGYIIDWSGLIDDDPRPYIDWLLAEGYIQEVTPTTPRLKGMPAMERTKKDNYYYQITIDGSLSRSMDTLPYIDREIFDYGNYYPTRSAAEEAAAWHRARTNLIRAAHRISGGTNGWVKGYGPNYYPVYLNDGGGITYLWNEYAHLMCESFLYLRTESQARKFAKEMKDDLMVYFGI